MVEGGREGERQGWRKEGRAGRKGVREARKQNQHISFLNSTSNAHQNHIRLHVLVLSRWYLPNCNSILQQTFKLSVLALHLAVSGDCTGPPLTLVPAQGDPDIAWVVEPVGGTRLCSLGWSEEEEVEGSANLHEVNYAS